MEINENYNESVSGGLDGQNTSDYVPDGMEIASGDNVGTKIEEIIFNRDKEKVTIAVLTDTVTPTSATIIGTDKNEDSYGWGKSYKVEQKVNED